MNAPPHISAGKRASLFRSNRNQAVRIPKELEFPEGVKQVYVRKHGRGLEIIPVSDFWDRFFERPGIDIEEPAELPYETRETF
jgi:antitoxin VapB